MAPPYRFFGDSEGEPRQLVSPKAQIEDWKSAIEYARGRDDVDGDRIALWGTSYSGGAVVVVAASDERIAAVSALVPMMDVQAIARDVIRTEGLGFVARATGRGLLDLTRALFGMDPLRIPTVGPPGSAAALTTPGAEQSYVALAAPDWRNEVCARIAITGGGYRPILHVSRVRCPMLLQIGEDDRLVPMDAIERAAELAKDKATVVRYPGDHFGMYSGPLFERAVSDQVTFFERHLRSSSIDANAASTAA